VAEVIKLHKEAEAARLEALAMDKELQISQLLGKLDLHPSGDPDLPQLVETSQGHPNQPKNNHRHSNNPRRSQPLKWRPQRGHQAANPQQHHRDNRQDHRVASRPQVAHQVANHHQGHLLDRQEARPRQQCHNNRHRRPMVAMGL
jgi:hypothetical protein